MTIGSIAAATPRPLTTSVPGDTAAKPAPDELVGNGRTDTRIFGGAVGLATGAGLVTGAALLTRDAPQVIRYGAIGASLAAMTGLTYLGQHVMGKATRSTRAEVDRAKDAKTFDLQVEIRTLQAKADGRISGRDEERIRTLRRERQDLAAGAPHVSWFARVGMPIVVGLGAGMAGMAIGGRPVPGDGKGMQAMFNGLAGMMVGTPIGMFAGYELGTTLFHGPHMTELPSETVAKVATIDAELDGLLGPA